MRTRPVHSSIRMTAQEGTLMDPAKRLKIVADGRVVLGRELALSQRPKIAPGRHDFFVSGRPSDGTIPPVDYTHVPAQPGELVAQQLGFALTDTDREICIESAGLCLSYGIFGRPGSGK